MEIKDYILDIYQKNGTDLNLDFSTMKFLNSSGINMLCKFFIEIRDAQMFSVTLIGKSGILWQQKTFEN